MASKFQTTKEEPKMQKLITITSMALLLSVGCAGSSDPGAQQEYNSQRRMEEMRDRVRDQDRREEQDYQDRREEEKARNEHQRRMEEMRERNRHDENMNN